MKSRALLITGLIAATTVIPSLAGAQSSGQPNQLTLDSSVGSRGDSMTIKAQVFPQGTKGTAVVASTPRTVGSGIANSSGVITITFKIPKDLADGEHTVKVTGKGFDGKTLAVGSTFVVSGGVLTPTGSNSLLWLIAAVGIVGFGGVLIGLGRRRSA